MRGLLQSLSIDLITHPKPKPMTEVNSAESYYQYRAESDAKIKSMSDEISRLQTDMFEGKLQSAIDKQVRDPDIGNLIFKLTRSSATETENGFNVGDLPLDRAIEFIRDNVVLRRFFSGTDIPAPAPKREFRQSWEY
jgi:hypothetical protein